MMCRATRLSRIGKTTLHKIQVVDGILFDVDCCVTGCTWVISKFPTEEETTHVETEITVEGKPTLETLCGINVIT